MKTNNLMIVMGMALIIICIFFACEQTVKESGDDSTTGASSSVSSSAVSSDSSSSSDGSSSSNEFSSSSDSSTSVSSSESSSSSSSVSSSPYAFEDNFNSYSIASPWTLEGGWTGNYPNNWSIVAGYDGNGVQDAAYGGKLISSYSGTDYTVSVKFRPTVITSNQGFGLVARRTAANVYYSAEIAYLSGSNVTRIAIYKANGTDGAQAGQTYVTGQLNTGTYYTLTLSVSGSINPAITATVTDGATSQTVSWTDTGTSLGSVLPGPGNACIWANAASIIFDDFTVTVP